MKLSGTEHDLWTVRECEDDGHFAKLECSDGTIATIPRWQAIALARMHNDAINGKLEEFESFCTTEARQIIANLIRFGKLEELLMANDDGIEGFSEWAALKSTIEDAKVFLGSEQLPRKEDE